MSKRVTLSDARTGGSGSFVTEEGAASLRGPLSYALNRFLMIPKEIVTVERGADVNGDRRWIGTDICFAQADREVPSRGRQAVPSAAELPEKLRAEPTADNRARRSLSSEPGLAVNTRSFSVRFSAVKT